MNSWIVSQVADLLSGNITVVKDVHAYTGNSKAITWKVKAMNGTEAADLNGAKCTVYVIREDQVTVVVEGTISGNLCEAVFKKECFAVPGVVKCLMNLTDASDTEFTVSAFEFVNGNGPTDKLVDPGEVLDINAALEAAKGAVRFDVEQQLTEAQKETARKNLDVGVGYAKQEDVEKIINREPQFFSVEGNPVQFESFAGVKLAPVTVLEPKQSGSGDPYPAGGGRNLLNNTATTQTVDGVTFTVNADGTVTVDGTATANAVFRIPCNLSVGETYTLSGCPAGGSTSTYFMQISNFGNDTGSGVTATATENTSSNVALFVFSGYAASNLVFKPMIRLASDTNSTYAPYSNIRPIIGYDKLDLSRAGKNLLPNTASTQTINGVTFTVNADGSITANGTATDVVFFNVGRVLLESGVSYVLSGCPAGGNNGGNFLMYVSIGSEFYYDFGSSVSFDGTGETRSVFIQVKSGATVDATFYPMIRLASDPDATYAPYASTFHTVQIGQTVYGGRFDWLTGKLVAEWVLAKGVFTRATLDSSGKLYAVTGIPSTAKPYPTTQEGLYEPYIVCTALLFKTLEAARRHGKPCITQYGTEIYIGGYIGKEAELDALLASDDFAVAYKLATPIEIQLTPTEIRALSGVNTLYGDGHITVTGRTDIGGVLDPDNDGYVDYAANAGKLGGQAPSHYAKADHGHSVGQVSGAFPAASYDALIVKKGNPVTEILKAGRGITAVTTIEPQQQGSGDPYPAGGGKNLLNYDILKTAHVEKGTAVWENYGVTLTATGNDCFTDYGDRFPEDAKIPVNEGDTITLSWETDSADKTGSAYIFPNGGTNGMVSEHNISNNKLTYTAGAGVTFVKFRFGVSSAGDTISYKNIQIEKGSEATDFQPYSNIRPFIGYDKLDLNAAGKNLANLTYRNSIPSINNGLDVAANGWASDYIHIGTNKAILSITEAIEGETFFLFLYDENKTFIGYNAAEAKNFMTVWSSTISGHENARYCRLRLSASESTSSRLQLELASDLTSYVPYQGNTYTVQIGQTVYGFRYEWLTGKGVIEWAMHAVTVGDFAKNGANQFVMIHNLSAQAFAECACSHFIGSKRGAYDSAVNNSATVSGTGLWFYSDAFETAEEFNEFINAQNAAGTPVQITYKLAQPIEIDLSAQAAGVIEALEGINTVYGDGDLEVTFNHDRLLTLMWNKLMLTT